MQLKFPVFAGIVLTSILMMTSCKKKNDLGRFIPANASIVVHMNAEALNKKLPWEEIKQNEFFKMLYADSSLSGMAKAALDNPENTGVDIKKDISFFMVKDTVGAYLAIIGTVKDPDKFKAYNSSVLKDANISEQNGVQFIARKGYVTSWDKDKFILVADLPGAGNMSRYQDMIANHDSLVMPEFPESQRDVIPVAASIYSLPEDQSLGENEKFGEMAENKGDLHFWVNSKAVYESAGNNTGLPMLNFNKLFENSYTAATVNFENGFIKVDAKSYASKEMADLWKKYGGSNISSNMVQRIPAKDVAVFFAMNFKPEGIKAFLQMMGLDGLANMALSGAGFNLDDFVKANKGDILIAVSGIRMNATITIDSATMKMDSSNRIHADFLFSASIDNKEAFNKLIAAGNQLGRQGMGPIASNLAYNKNDKYFAIGNNAAQVNQFIAKESNNKFAFMDKVSASPFAGYVDLQSILTSFRPAAAKDSLAAIAMDASLRIWDNIIMSGGEFANGAMTQHVEINMLDKNTNSLKQLNNYTGQLAVIARAKKNEHEASGWKQEGMKKDSATMQNK